MKMNKIYVVTILNYTSRWIEGVFSSLEKANELVKKLNDNDKDNINHYKIFEFELDNIQNIYSVEILFNGEINKYREMSIYEYFIEHLKSNRFSNNLDLSEIEILISTPEYYSQVNIDKIIDLTENKEKELNKFLINKIKAKSSEEAIKIAKYKLDELLSFQKILLNEKIEYINKILKKIN